MRLMKIFKKLSVSILSLCLILFCSTIQVNATCEFSTSAKSAYLVDYLSGEEIYAYNAEERLTIASMTKIMLLDIVFDEIDKGNLHYDDLICVSDKASGMGGSQVYLQKGGNYSVYDLIKSVVVASANDASVALAEKIAGSEDAFVGVMNERCKCGGLTNTLFSNCTGLPKPTQYSCAKDVSNMMRSLISHEDYFKFSNIWTDEIVHPNGEKTLITNTNKLSKFYEGCDGGKTGFTNESKFCLSATAKRGNMRLIGVVIGEDSSKERFKDVSEMFNKGFAAYENVLAVDKNKPIDKKARVLGSVNEYEDLYPDSDLAVLTKKNQKVEYTISETVEDNLKAPIKAGTKVGEIIVFKNGIEYCRTDIVTNTDIGVASFSDVYEKIASLW